MSSTSERSTTNMYRWLACSTAVFQAQTLYLLVISYNSMTLWPWFVGYFVVFGLGVPTLGHYCVHREQHLYCFAGLQATIGVCNLVFFIVGLCSIVTLHSLCHSCLEVFKNNNDTCEVGLPVELDVAWCSECKYIVPSILLGVTTYVSFMSASCAHKLYKTSTSKTNGSSKLMENELQ